MQVDAYTGGTSHDEEFETQDTAGKTRANLKLDQPGSNFKVRKSCRRLDEVYFEKAVSVIEALSCMELRMNIDGGRTHSSLERRGGLSASFPWFRLAALPVLGALMEEPPLVAW